MKHVSVQSLHLIRLEHQAERRRSTSRILFLGLRRGELLATCIKRSCCPLIGMATTGRTRALIFERAGRNARSTTVFGLATAMGIAGNVKVDHPELDRSSAIRHIPQREFRVRYPVWIATGAFLQPAPVKADGEVSRIGGNRQRHQRNRQHRGSKFHASLQIERLQHAILIDSTSS